MQRRDFITGIVFFTVIPFAARAQQAGPTRRIAVLMAFAENDPEAQANIRVFREALTIPASLLSLADELIE